VKADKLSTLSYSVIAVLISHLFLFNTIYGPKYIKTSASHRSKRINNYVSLREKNRYGETQQFLFPRTGDIENEQFDNTSQNTCRFFVGLSIAQDRHVEPN